MAGGELLEKEAEAFDKQSDERIANGLVPDFRRLRRVDWFYNNVWREPEFVRIELMPKVDFVLDVVRKNGGRAAELGCGYGMLSLEMARNGLAVVGIDLSPKSIAHARRFAEENPYKEGFGSLEYLCADIMESDLGTESYDSVVFFGTLHHMPDAEAVLDKVKRMLKPGGRLAIVEPVRDNFTMESAEFAAVMRTVLPTWIPYEEKLKASASPEAWERYVKSVFDEYTYKEEHVQSPCDNLTSSEKDILDAIGRRFIIEEVRHSDAFVDKLMGGLRGDDRHALARHLKFLDDEMIRTGALPPTSVWVHAVRK